MSAPTTWVDSADPLASLPKVSLHDHLDGSLRPETLLELASASGVVVPRTDPAQLTAWMRDFAALEPGRDWEDLFGLSTSVMQTADQLRRVAREYVGTLVADGVVYAETRWAPEKHLSGSLDMHAAIAAVDEGLAQGMADAARTGRPVEVRQLLSVMRNTTHGPEVVGAALRARTAGIGVVGVDLAGHEDGHPAAAHQSTFSVAVAAGLARTIHAGESDGVGSVSAAIEVCSAMRIGHGARLVEDIAIDGVHFGVRDAAAAWERTGRSVAALDLGPVATLVRDRGIALELCPTSNTHGEGVVDTFAQHPIALLTAAGIATTVSPDNRMLMGVSITSEFRRLVDTFGWDVDDLRRATDTALDAAFVDDDTTQRIREERILPGWS